MTSGRNVNKHTVIMITWRNVNLTYGSNAKMKIKP